MKEDVPLSVALHVILFPLLAKVLVEPTEIDFHVTPSSFETSMLIEVDDGVYPMALASLI